MRLFTDSVALNDQDLQQRGWLSATGKIQLPANNPWALLAGARFLQWRGAEARALEALEHAQRLRPADLLITLWRAHGLARLRRLDEADELFRQVGQRFSELARITRMGDRGWEWVLAKPFEPETDAAWTWLVRPPDEIRTLLLVSVDGRYWLHYGKRLLESCMEPPATTAMPPYCTYTCSMPMRPRNDRPRSSPGRAGASACVTKTWRCPG